MPPAIDREACEAQIRATWERGEHAEAAGQLIECYGGGILSFLTDRVGAFSIAEEVFSDFAENVLRGIPGFRWNGTARAWAYRIARNAAAEYFRKPDRRPGRRVTLSAPEVDRAAAKVRTTTAAHLRTDNKNRLRELRRELSEEDQLILVLRLDRQFSWEEIAAITSNAPGPLADPQVRTEANRLRQRFKRAKAQLRKLAQQSGLISQDAEPEDEP